MSLLASSLPPLRSLLPSFIAGKCSAGLYSRQSATRLFLLLLMLMGSMLMAMLMFMLLSISFEHFSLGHIDLTDQFYEYRCMLFLALQQVSQNLHDLPGGRKIYPAHDGLLVFILIDHLQNLCEVIPKVGKRLLCLGQCPMCMTAMSSTCVTHVVFSFLAVVVINSPISHFPNFP